MHNFPPNINWRLTTILATALGFIACDDFTSHEQVAIGNWIIQIGQTMITNATYQDLIERRITKTETINLNSKEFKCGGSPFIKNDSINFQNFYNSIKKDLTDIDIANLQKAINRINIELQKLNKEFGI